MNNVSFADLQVGDELPNLEIPALTRQVLAIYCGASGDFNPLHVDIDYARNVAGREDVIGHGSLTMAWLARMLTDWIPQRSIRQFKVRLHSPLNVGDRVICCGRISEKTTATENRILVELRADTVNGTCLAQGSALLIIDQ